MGQPMRASERRSCARHVHTYSHERIGPFLAGLNTRSSLASFYTYPSDMSVYAASVNPGRRAKAILPKPNADDEDDYEESPPTPGQAKRGRKPGTMSRTAREAQRKLNHSIIEKARRTKINDALGTLRQLVPENFGAKAEEENNDEVDEDDDGEFGRGKGRGKKAEKEKEFKLEILVRTVAYMQHLIGRVQELEAEGKRKAAEGVDEPKRKKQRTREDEDRLPSISTWLNSSIDPSLQSPRIAQLPSPPSSTSFAPVSQLFQAPPALTLSPTEDAELLLHMSSYSPSFRARSDSSSASCPPLVLEKDSKPLTPGLMLGLRR